MLSIWSRPSAVSSTVRREARPPDRAAGNAPDADGKPARETELPFEHQKIAAGQERCVADIEVVRAPQRESPRQRSGQNEATMVAVGIERSLRDNDDGPGERTACRWQRDGFKALVAAQPGKRMPATAPASASKPKSRVRHRRARPASARKTQAPCRLWRRVGRAGPRRRRPPSSAAACRRRAPSRQAGVRNAGQVAAGVLDETSGEPEPRVGDGVDRLAVGAEVEARPRAEGRIARVELESAQKIERPEMRLAAPGLKCADRERTHLDRREARRGGECASGEKRHRYKRAGKRPLQRRSARHCSVGRRGRAGRRAGSAACSSNSSASLSVIAPASSSASTMVTARR